MEAEPHGQEVLLVDEVDVFFGGDFYGRTHNQVAVMESPEVENLLREMWTSRDMAQALPELIRKVLACPQYQALLQKYPDFADVIESEAMQMCVDLKDHMENPKDYVLCNGQICYKVMDGVVFDVVKGYKTAFAYLQEATNGSLQDEDTALTKALTLRVPCGRFSYAKLGSPKILGVSGTIEALGDYEWNLLLFMSDGVNGDGDCVGSITEMQREFPTTVVHAVIFRQQDSPVLRGMMNAVKGEFHVSIDGVKLLETFSTIASGLEYTGRG